MPTDVLADVDIVVRVELGAAEIPASAWAKTRAGDVIALGRKVGEPVVLRVSGTEVAKGELVHVDGELGVRILSRTGEVFR
jgi:flagellar motor switch protein FliM